MRQMHFGELTEADRRRNEYLDNVNRAPYFTITLLMIGLISVFTLAVSLGAF